MNDQLTDISDVCKMFGLTSRTLRFYEEKKVISSTPEIGTNRRRYSEAQIAQLKNVLVLRKIGLSLEDIYEVLTKDGNLREALVRNKAKIYASIYEQNQVLNLLDEALAAVENGKNLFEAVELDQSVEKDEKLIEYARICTEAFVHDQMDILYSYMSEKIIARMPKDIFQKQIRTESLEPVGDFERIGEYRVSRRYSNVIYYKIFYSLMGVELKYIFHDEKIAGFWMEYFELD